MPSLHRAQCSGLANLRRARAGTSIPSVSTRRFRRGRYPDPPPVCFAGRALPERSVGGEGFRVPLREEEDPQARGRVPTNSTSMGKGACQNVHADGSVPNGTNIEKLDRGRFVRPFAQNGSFPCLAPKCRCPSKASIGELRPHTASSALGPTFRSTVRSLPSCRTGLDDWERFAGRCGTVVARHCRDGRLVRTG